MKRQRSICISLLLLALFITLALDALASSTLYVNGVSGSDGNSCTSLARACRTISHAIAQSSSGDSIIVAAATYRENLSIASNLTITGASAPTTIIDGGHTAAVITIRGGSVNLSQMTIRNGSGLSYGGGGIYNAGTLTITNTTVSGNTSNDNVVTGGGLGGGIYNIGTLTIIQSTVSGNTVSRGRIGASAVGAGIYNAGRLTITNSTLSGNQAADYWPAGATNGGGLANENGTVMINNSTVSQNAAIFHTPLGTVGGFGGGIYNNSSAAPSIQNSIVANNTWGGNCNGRVTSHGYNMSSDGTCNFNAFSYFPIFERTTPDKLGIFVVNMNNRVVQKIPGSDGLWSPRWSPDGRYIVARSVDPLTLMLYDLRSQKWSRIVDDTYVGDMRWSSDGRYVYYSRRGTNPAILRVRIADSAIDQVTDLKDIRQTGYRGGFWMGLTPDDSPLVLRDVGAEEIYSLDLTTQ